MGLQVIGVALPILRRNKCLGTDCRWIVNRREKQFLAHAPEICGKRKDGGENCVSRTEQESERRKREMANLLVLPTPTDACKMAQALVEKLDRAGNVKKKRMGSVSQTAQLTRTPEPLLSKGKGTQPLVQITRL